MSDHDTVESWIGADAIVDGWLGQLDQPGDADFEWHVLAVEGDTAIIRGVSTYRVGPIYDNVWIVRLSPGGRATAFTEFWIERPARD